MLWELILPDSKGRCALKRMSVYEFYGTCSTSTMRLCLIVRGGGVDLDAWLLTSFLGLKEHPDFERG